MDLKKLYTIADGNSIDIDYFPMKKVVSISTFDSVAIDVRKINSTAEETTILGHELGHCMTGSFYQIRTLETKERMEYRANKWAFQMLIPCRDLNEAFENGITETYELAEYFNVTEDFIRKAVFYYKTQES